ncbi:histidine phosphatase family protein [Parasalinivibrio latis]|uniref:SixA phosphatase family protein n=1 Tax=Parasalinivibrio latis TaxID=2952610 RepID=UPI0030E4E72B
MKWLFLLRHAKSSWDNPGLKDHDRPLNSRGKKNVPEMVRRLNRWLVLPDIIYSSSAVRAESTAKVFATGLNSRPQLEILKNLYTEDCSELLEQITGFEDGYENAMLVAHNPALNELVNQFGFDVENLPTCSIVVIRIETDSWQDAGKAKWQFLFHDYPKF